MYREPVITRWWHGLLRHKGVAAWLVFFSAYAAVEIASLYRAFDDYLNGDPDPTSARPKLSISLVVVQAFYVAFALAAPCCLWWTFWLLRLPYVHTAWALLWQTSASSAALIMSKSNKSVGLSMVAGGVGWIIVVGENFLAPLEQARDAGIAYEDVWRRRLVFDNAMVNMLVRVLGTIPIWFVICMFSETSYMFNSILRRTYITCRSAKKVMRRKISAVSASSLEDLSEHDGAGGVPSSTGVALYGGAGDVGVTVAEDPDEEDYAFTIIPPPHASFKLPPEGVEPELPGSVNGPRGAGGAGGASGQTLPWQSMGSAQIRISAALGSSASASTAQRSRGGGGAGGGAGSPRNSQSSVLPLTSGKDLHALSLVRAMANSEGGASGSVAQRWQHHSGSAGAVSINPYSRGSLTASGSRPHGGGVKRTGSASSILSSVSNRAGVAPVPVPGGRHHTSQRRWGVMEADDELEDELNDPDEYVFTAAPIAQDSYYVQSLASSGGASASLVRSIASSKGSHTAGSAYQGEPSNGGGGGGGGGGGDGGGMLANTAAAAAAAAATTAGAGSRGGGGNGLAASSGAFGSVMSLLSGSSMFVSGPSQRPSGTASDGGGGGGGGSWARAFAEAGGSSGSSSSLNAVHPAGGAPVSAFSSTRSMGMPQSRGSVGSAVMPSYNVPNELLRSAQNNAAAARGASVGSPMVKRGSSASAWASADDQDGADEGGGDDEGGESRGGVADGGGESSGGVGAGEASFMPPGYASDIEAISNAHAKHWMESAYGQQVLQGASALNEFQQLLLELLQQTVRCLRVVPCACVGEGRR